MAIPTSADFATEVKSDRLNILWRVTLAITVLIGFIIAGFGFRGADSDIVTLAMPFLLIIGGCLLTGSLLRRNQYTFGVWAYALGGVAASGFAMIYGGNRAYEIVPFVFPIVVFMVGLMLPPVSTFLMASIATLIVLFAPVLTALELSVSLVNPITAIVLTFLSAIFSAQVTGELYQIAEWALSNYQRERRTNDELFEKRQQLQKSLQRSEALSEVLKETNTELEIARSAAEEAKHFRGQFLANMSHELRTPLNAIIGFSETMLRFPVMYDNVPLPQEYHGDLEQIYNSGRQLLHVINDILDLARVDAGKLDVVREKVDLQAILSAVKATARGLTAQKPIELKWDFPDPLPDVWADASRLRQVLLNLYSNATKFTDSGEIKLRVRVQSDKVLFSVSDTGSGIPDYQQKLIFDEFSQAEATGRDPRAGAGLGLTISRQLLDLMGGEIWVESEVGKGSTFHFTIPRYDGQEVGEDTEERRAEMPQEIKDTKEIDKLLKSNGIEIPQKQQSSVTHPAASDKS